MPGIGAATENAVTRKLHIASDLTLPLDWMTMATVVYGARGAGKTTLAAVIAEELHKNGQRFCAIDLKGDLYGLKSTADGKAAGIPIVIFGGERADLPLEPDAGKFLGELVAGLEQSVVLDLEGVSKGKQVRFLGDFFAALYHCNRELLLVIADEAQRYAPQKPMSPDASVCLGAVEDLVKLGRKHGLGVLLLTQRGSGLNKEVSEICDMLVAFRTPGALDQDRIRNWLEANWPKEKHRNVLESLAGLERGQAVFASAHPDLSLYQISRVRPRETFDSSATPEIGKRKHEPKVLAQSELAAIKEKMSTAIERAEAEDPKKLREKVRTLQVERDKLKRQLETASSRVATKEKRVEVPVLGEKELARLEKLIEKFDDVRDRAAQAQQAVVSEVGSLKTIVERARQPAAPPKEYFRDVPRIMKRGASDNDEWRVAELRQAGAHGANGALPEGEAVILAALIQYPQGLRREQLTVLTGYKRSTRDLYLQKLARKGYTVSSGGAIVAAELGRAALPNAEPLPTGEALREHWRQRLPQGEWKILKVLVEAYPRWLGREVIGEQAGFKHSTRDLYLQKLARRELVENENKSVRASATLFDEVHV